MYLLVSAEYLAHFETYVPGTENQIYRLEEPIEPFKNSHPLLQGFSRAELVLERDTFQLILRGDKVPRDLARREKLLRELTAGTTAGEGIVFSFIGNHFQVDGTRSALHLTTWDGPGHSRSHLELGTQAP